MASKKFILQVSIFILIMLFLKTLINNDFVFSMKVVAVPLATWIITMPVVVLMTNYFRNRVNKNSGKDKKVSASS